MDTIKVRLCLIDASCSLPVQFGADGDLCIPDGLEGEVLSYEENNSVVIVRFEDFTIALPAQYLSRLH